MRFQVRLWSVLLCLLAAAAGAAADDDVPMEIRLHVTDHRRLDELSRLVSITDAREGEVHALVSPRRLRELAAAGFTWTVVAETKVTMVTMCPAGWDTDPDRSWDCYPSYQQYVGLLEGLAEAHPDLCRLEVLGQTANRARPHRLWALRITDDPDREEDEPEVLLTSTMHGDEGTGMILLLRLADELLSTYGSDPETARLVDSTEIWINPDANPDGTYFAGDGTVAGATRSYTTAAGGATSVDPNRNFPDPAYGDHPDGRAWWPETRAWMRFASEHTISLSANLHDGAEVVNYPWDTWDRTHADDAWFVALSRAWADLAHEDGPLDYMRSPSYDGITRGYSWYPVHGGRGDFMTFFHSSRELTVEVSDYKTLYGRSLERLWVANRRALRGFIAAAGAGLRGVVRGPEGQPLEATIHLVDHDVEEDRSWVTTDPDVGDFHRMVLPGVYTVRITSPGYEPLEMGGVSVSPEVATTLDVALQPASGVTVAGIVTAAATGEPVAHATVEMRGSELRTLTDGDGRYFIHGTPSGSWTFRTTAPGFAPAEATVEVSGPQTTLDIALRLPIARPSRRLAPGADAR